mmetsp:Transcript_37644/g.103922  ORF Transcript_37644/g.103922 Transcript_37644/m.103922 type:complete len:101 (+) Transcript_37644:1054-1356(+)
MASMQPSRAPRGSLPRMHGATRWKLRSRFLNRCRRSVLVPFYRSTSSSSQAPRRRDQEQPVAAWHSDFDEREAQHSPGNLEMVQSVPANAADEFVGVHMR